MKILYYAQSLDNWSFGEDPEETLDFLEGEPLYEPTKLPTVIEVCPRCGGKGTHDHPAFANGITSSEWDEWDHDERQSYMNGAYDVKCTECNGRKVVDALDMELIARDTPVLHAALIKRLEEEAAHQREVAAERSMEA